MIGGGSGDRSWEGPGFHHVIGSRRIAGGKLGWQTRLTREYDFLKGKNGAEESLNQPVP